MENYRLFDTSYKMPHNKYNRNDIAIETGFRFICGQTFNSNLERERNIKIRMHKKFCSSCPDNMGNLGRFLEKKAMLVTDVRIV